MIAAKTTIEIGPLLFIAIAIIAAALFYGLTYFGKGR
jgi:hypothetical protein